MKWYSLSHKICTFDSMSWHKMKRYEHQLKNIRKYEHASNLWDHFFRSAKKKSILCREKLDAKRLRMNGPIASSTSVFPLIFSFWCNIFSHNSVSKVVLWWFIGKWPFAMQFTKLTRINWVGISTVRCHRSPKYWTKMKWDINIWVDAIFYAHTRTKSKFRNDGPTGVRVRVLA